MMRGKKRRNQHNIESRRPLRGVYMAFMDLEWFLHGSPHSKGKRQAFCASQPLFWDLLDSFSQIPLLFLPFFCFAAYRSGICSDIPRRQKHSAFLFDLPFFLGLLSISSWSFLYIHINALASMILMNEHFTSDHYMSTMLEPSAFQEHRRHQRSSINITGNSWRSSIRGGSSSSTASSATNVSWGS